MTEAEKYSKNSIGFVTGCHGGDVLFAKGTLASLRHYAKENPICLIVDGSVDVKDLIEVYKCRTIRTQEIPDSEFKALAQGNPRTKMAAHWWGPFERYVWLDSDAILWGDFVPELSITSDFQIFTKANPGRHKVTKEGKKAFAHFYFDPDQIAKYDPDFDWEIGTYFCAGAYACRRNVIPLDLWMDVEEYRKLNPTAIAGGDQGTLNYIVNKLGQENRLTIDYHGFQHIPVEHGQQDLAAKKLGLLRRLPEKVENPRIIHYCGIKPLIQNQTKLNSRPFQNARYHHYKIDRQSKIALLRVVCEELKIFLKRIIAFIRRNLCGFWTR